MERSDRGIKARTDDIFALSSYREMSYLILPRLLLVVGLFALPLFLETIWVKVLIFACVMALLALSWDLIASVGMVSMGQALFFGVGGYLAGALCRNFGLSPLITIPLATLGGAILCTAVLLPTLRLKSIYFAIVTLALSIMFGRLIEATGILGGTEGLHGISPFPNLWVELYLVAVVLLICLFGFRRLINTDYGVVMRAIKDNERAVMSGGINIHWYKVQAVFMGSAVGAFAGAFMTHVHQAVGIHAFAKDLSLIPLASGVTGGIGTLAGPVLAALILVPISEALRGMGVMRIVFFALTLVLFVVRIPEGIFPYMRRKYHQFERLVETEVK
jgi:branched-chain amino acid transport system permease protein